MDSMDLVACKEYVDKLREEYIENHKRIQERDELISENNIEQRDIKGYHGREILELLQNADDAYQKSIEDGKHPQCDLEITISYKNNVLIISNTGTCFDKDGVKAIVQGNNSPKSGRYIGNKGTGFRSILNWATAVRIYSGGFNIEFSKEIASEYFKKISEEEQIKKQISKNPSLYIPMLAVPQNISDGHFNDRTTIEVMVDPNKINDGFSVMKQIENIDLRILLFLPNTCQIDIETDNTRIRYRREISQGDMKEVKLQKIVNETIELEENFYLFEKTKYGAISIDGVSKDALLAIAVPVDYSGFVSKNMYSFFPLLDTESPFDCVMHGSFELGDQRNTINNSGINRCVIEWLIDLLIEIANKFAAINRHDVAYKLITPLNYAYKEWRFTSSIAKFDGIEDYYCNLLSKQKMFRTVNGRNISIEDNPKAIKSLTLDFLKGEAFESILNINSEERVFSFVDYLIKRNSGRFLVEEEELAEMINAITDDLSVNQQVETFIWWDRLYRDSLPNLLKTQNDEWLKYGEECYFLVGDFLEQSIPSWVRIPALNTNYQSTLFDLADAIPEVKKAKEVDKEAHVSRIISQNNIFRTVNFKYRDRSNIIPTVNSSVETYDNAIDFVKWLWVHYKNEEVNWNPPGRNGNAKISYRFPSLNKGETKDSEALYFGKEYGNNFSEKLFSENYGAFPSVIFFGVHLDDEIHFVDFIEKFGVKRYPPIQSQNVTPSIQYTDEYKETIKKSPWFGASTSFKKIAFFLPFIEQLEEVLSKLTMAEIIQWIYKDSALDSFLSSQVYANDAYIIYQGNYDRTDHRYNTRIRNYILEVFNRTPWVEVSGEKYAPSRVLRTTDLKHNQKFAALLPTFGLSEIETLSQCTSISIDEIIRIIDKFAFAEVVTDLESEDFYGLMLKIPKLESKEAVDLSKIVYRLIEQPAFDKKFSYSAAKTKFFAEGMLLVQHQGQLQFESASKAYLPSTTIINKKSIPIVDKGVRTNNDNFVRVFGCQKYERAYSIEQDSIVYSLRNDEFQEYFAEFKKYARAYAERNEQINKHGSKIKIELVSSISIIENNVVIPIEEEYACISDSVTSWFILLKSDGFDINSLSEIIENIYSNIANTPGFDAGKIGELFRTSSREGREFLIKKEFGSLNVIEDDYYKNEIKVLFMNVLNTLIPEIQTEFAQIDFDDFSGYETSKTIIQLFKEYKIDVEEFEGAGFIYPINLVPYYRRLISEFIRREKRNYKDYLFQKAQSDDSLKKSFIDDVNSFENYRDDHITNSVNYDLEGRIIDRFGEWRCNPVLQHCDDIYNSNYEAMNEKNEFAEELMNDAKAQMYIYFHMDSEFNKWLEHQRQRLTSANEHKESPYEKLRNIIPEETEIKYSMQSESSQKNKGGHGGSYTVSGEERKSRNKQILGDKGELLIYNALREKYGADNVFPRSEAYVRLGILKPGQSESGKYDISYKDKDGVEYFVEVKAGDGNAFYISEGELKFAEDNSDRFILALVNNVDAEIPEYIMLPSKFWADSRFHLTKIIEKIEVRF